MQKKECRAGIGAKKMSRIMVMIEVTRTMKNMRRHPSEGSLVDIALRVITSVMPTVRSTAMNTMTGSVIAMK